MSDPSVPGVDDRCVVLTGFMATGKSTIGRLLAGRLGFEFVDTDELIERAHGPIPEIFATRGEDAFRAIEREVAAGLADRRRLVVSTGGRMLLDPANIAALTRNGRVFCLTAAPEAILARVSGGNGPAERPLLAVDDPRARIAELLAEREEGYRRFPQIATDAATPERVADDLADLVRAEPERLSVGACDVVVGAAILPLVSELAGIDGPIAVVTDAATAHSYLPLLPSPDLVIRIGNGDIDRDSVAAATGGASAVVALGGREVGAAAAAIADRSDRDFVSCPTDLGAVVRSASGRPSTVIVDVATIQALGRNRLTDELAEHAPGVPADALPAEVTEPGALAELRSLVARVVRSAASPD